MFNHDLKKSNEKHGKTQQRHAACGPPPLFARWRHGPFPHVGLLSLEAPHIRRKRQLRVTQL